MIIKDIKGQIIENVDFAKGTLSEIKTEIISEEEGHFETIAEYENGGKDVKWVVDKEKVIQDYQVFIPYTDDELKKIEINKLKSNLANSDYQAVKYAEGLISEEDYATIKAQRQKWRDEINELEKVD